VGRSRRQRLRLLAAPLVVAAGYGLLLVAWAIGNPPFAAPDEPAHYLRALAVGGGSLEGRIPVSVPARLWAVNADCNKLQPEVSAACVYRAQTVDHPNVELSTAGMYPPLAYVAPGLAERAAGDAFDADRAGRLATIAVSFVLLVVTVLLLWEPPSGRLSLLGTTIAVTPMVLFVDAIVNSSALETATGLAFAAALLRLARGDPGATRVAVWAALSTTGAILELSRSTGIVWVVLDAGLVAAFVGLRAAARIVRSRPYAAAATVVVLALAAAGNRAWEAVYGSDITREGPATFAFVHSIGSSLAQLPRLQEEWVGVFGWLDAHLPPAVDLTWQLFAAVLFAAALLLGRRREAGAVVAALLLAIVVAVALSGTLAAAGQGGLQSRHVLPFLVVIPLLAGETLVRNPRRAQGLNIGAFVWATAAVVAVTQVIAWWWNGRRQAVGDAGPLFFPAHAQWSPPAGWWPWFAAAVLGSLLLAGGMVAARPRAVAAAGEESPMGEPRTAEPRSSYA
jgi:hypothetical protein